MIPFQRTFNPNVLPIITSPRPFYENRSPYSTTVPQHGFEVLPHDFMDSHMFLLEQVIMRAAPIGVHGT
eukprot:7818364-Lingulodinium_polyedra.AAC.1